MNVVLKLEVLRACVIKRVRLDLYGTPCTFKNWSPALQNCIEETCKNNDEKNHSIIHGFFQIDGYLTSIYSLQILIFAYTCI